MTQLLIEWMLTIVGSGGIGAVITYFCTLPSKKKLAKAEADSASLDVLLKHQDLRQDQCDYLLKTCDKYIKDYHDLEADFRRQMSEISEQMAKLLMEKSTVILNKCNEIAELRSKVTYLKGIRCYNFTCPNRIKTNPDKTEE